MLFTPINASSDAAFNYLILRMKKNLSLSYTVPNTMLKGLCNYLSSTEPFNTKFKGADRKSIRTDGTEKRTKA
jgi:hypothetical protein